ncbi:hypothetical protein KY290_005325 [Solanum tuberosum]|uniref:USP domain-containing protein n=1 Tax=Solanum tuberosum TaxID=4113 RepID=A0ABQ7WDT6_SOLTU|nr:hypothetical protein KY289_005712 [Solanum tuberosum]KAH0778898.1 hypothetical protein KY290_005325 [Solanum tuberosum]
MRQHCEEGLWWLPCEQVEGISETPSLSLKSFFLNLLIRCCNCGHQSVTNEPLIDLSLENEDVDSVPPALESFTKIEKIEFSCEKCKIQGPFEKKLLVERASYVAVVHLKRFKNGGFVVQKVDKHVSFPLELDMLLYTNEINNKEMKYNLYAVIVHSNFSNFSGHYYSFIHCTPNAWYKFDCKQILWVQEDLVLAEQTYIMFYAKRGTPWFSEYIQIHKPCMRHLRSLNPTKLRIMNQRRLLAPL